MCSRVYSAQSAYMQQWGANAQAAAYQAQLNALGAVHTPDNPPDAPLEVEYTVIEERARPRVSVPQIPLKREDEA